MAPYFICDRSTQMTVGHRIRGRLPGAGISAAELARRVGMSQSGMANLIAGRSRTTTYLHKIARHLGTTAAYLSGETDDPEADAPAFSPLPAAPVHVFLPVELPPEDALVRMFVGLLASIKADADPLEQAQLLAKRLPTALARVSNLRREPRNPNQDEDAPAAAEILSTRHRERQG